MSVVNGSMNASITGLFQTNASMFITVHAGAALPDQQIPAAMRSAEAAD